MSERRITSLSQAITPVLAISRLQLRTDRRLNPLTRIDRWQAAFELLDDKERKILADASSPTTVVNIDAILQTVRTHQERVEKGRLVLYTRSDGKIIYVRDILNILTNNIRRFQSAFGTLVQCDTTGHAAAPWAVIQICINMVANDIEAFGDMLSSVTRISEVIARNAELEKEKFFGVSELKKQLSTSIIKLYRAVLSFLCRARKYLSRSSTSRVMRGALQSADEVAGKHLKLVDDAEQEVMRLAAYVGDEDQGKRLSAIPKTTVDEFKRHAAEEAASVGSRRQKLLEWIQALDTEDTLRGILDKKQEGTCSWIFQKEAFQLWSNKSATQPSLLWIHGPPGFGKTFLSASICQHYNQQTDTIFSPFFCLAEDESFRDPFAVLKRWISDAVAQSAEAVHAMFKEYQSRKGQSETATNADLWKAFKAVGKVVTHLTLLVDGYDECTQAKSTLKYHADESQQTYFLQTLLAAMKSTRIKLVLISRDTPQISSALTTQSCNSSGLLRYAHAVTPEDSSQDITMCSKAMIRRTFPRKFSDETKEQLAIEAASRSEGMFLWLAMLGKSMKQWHSEDTLRKKIADMPSELERVYEMELEKMLRPNRDDNAAEVAKSILRWTLFAARPLTIREMAEALVLAPGGKAPLLSREDIVPEDWSDIDAEYIDFYYKKPCGVLIQIKSQTETTPLSEQTIHFPHFSIKEFLLRRGDGGAHIRAEQLYLEDSVTENHQLAKLCLEYLCLDVVPDQTTIANRTISLKEKIKLRPFLVYSSKYWSQHATLQNGVAPELLPYIQKLFNPVTAHWKLWSEVFEAEPADDDIEPGEENGDGIQDTNGNVSDNDRETEDATLLVPDESEGSTTIEDLNPMCYAACLGLTEIVADMLDKGFDCHAPSGTYSFSLMAAAVNGHLKTVQCLVEYGANINQHNDQGHAAVHAAAHYGHADVLEYLAMKGAILNEPDENNMTPAQHACYCGCKSALQVLLPNDEGLHDVNDARESLLSIAIEGSQEVIVQLLLEHDAAPSTLSVPNDFGVTTPLGLAFVKATIKIIEILIGRGADLTAAVEKDNLLVLMASRNHQQHFIWLWDRGFRQQSPDRFDYMAQHWASIHNNIEILQAMIGETEILASTDSQPFSALFFAVDYGNLEAVKLLCDHEASTSPRHKLNGHTAVYAACLANELEILKYLLDIGADAHETYHGKTGFDLAIGSQNVEILKLLISCGALRDSGGNFIAEYVPVCQTALLNKMEDVQHELLKLEVHQRASAMSAALSAAVAGGAREVVSWLCDQHVTEGFIGTNGRTVIHMAVSGGSEEILKRLLDAGHNCTIPDDFECIPAVSAAVTSGKQAEALVIHLTVRGGFSQERQPGDLNTPDLKSVLGRWDGSYTYVEWQSDTQEPTAFELQSHDTCLAIKSGLEELGVSKEASPLLFHSAGSDEAGAFTVYGQLITRRELVFVKLYPHHGWLYHGEISEDGRTMKGTWGSSPQLRHGTFQVTRCGVAEHD